MTPYLLSQLVVAAADRNPASPAVRSGDGELSYGELASRTEALAATLQACGVARGDRVGLFLHKSVASYVAVHAILRSGAAYVPIDPFAPAAFVAEIIEECGIAVVVSENRLAATLSQVAAAGSGLRVAVGMTRTVAGVRTVGSDEIAAAAGTLDPVPVLGDDLAYVMVTSGSTGRPKGIAHTHRSGLRYASQAVEVYGVRPEDRLANSAPFHFDISTFELFAGPLAGASTLVIPEPHLKMPASLAQLLEQDRSTFWYSVPFLLRELLARGALAERDLSSLRWVLFGGEVMPPETLAALMAHLPGARFSNSYGPAEVNQCSFYHLSGPPPLDEPVPIGRPMPDAELRLVTAEGELVADGEAGELLVRCSTMMDRYWGRDDLTAAAFVHTALPGGRTARWYRTGDLVRRRPDGDYEFLGRVDNQVKVRGNRVELEAVEAVLSAVPGVRHAVAGVVSVAGNEYLAAGYAPLDGCCVDAAAALAALASTLPPYAVPHRLVRIDDLPVTASGKLDRRAVRLRLATLLSNEGVPQ